MKCNRCDYEWKPKSNSTEAPSKCPKCGSHDYDVPRKYNVKGKRNAGN